VNARDSAGVTPLLTACSANAWAATHALLDCGARVDMPSIYAGRLWPVILVVDTIDSDNALLRRILSADSDASLRFRRDGAARDCDE